MKWYRKLYVGKKAQADRNSIVYRIKRGKPQMGVYVLTLPANRENVLDIYPSYTLLQPHYKKMNLYVVGIARGREEALELMVKIVMDAYKSTGSYKVAGLIEK